MGVYKVTILERLEYPCGSRAQRHLADLFVTAKSWRQAEVFARRRDGGRFRRLGPRDVGYGVISWIDAEVEFLKESKNDQCNQPIAGE